MTVQANVEKAKMENLVKKSIKMAAEYNANLMRELRQERKAYFDLQTFVSKKRVLINWLSTGYC